MENIRMQVSCIATRNQKIAMIKKTNQTYKTYNMFIPPGGHVEHMEKLEEACKKFTRKLD